MTYGKLRDGVLVIAPNPLTFGGRKTYNPPAKFFEMAGYLPVEETSQPDDGGYYVSTWAEQDGKIVQVWTAAEPPSTEPDVPTWEETTNKRISSLENAVDDLIIAQLEVSGNV